MADILDMPGIAKEFPFKPLSNYVVIEIEEPKERVVNNIIIPASVKQMVINADIVAISDEKEKDGSPMVKTVKVGDKVIFDVRVGQMVTIGDKEYLVMRETDLFGVLTSGEGGALLVTKNNKKSGIISPRIVN